MDEAVRRIVAECTRGSDEGRMPFPEVARRLVAAGVERYHADLSRAEKIYYLPDGSSHAVPCAPLDRPAAAAFRPAGVDAAVRASQAGAISYAHFCEAIAEAGCVGYLVTFAGRRAVYYGRTGETHVEPFP